jgi:predicted amidohydrolase YtcJ
LLDSKAIIASGSDAPVELISPFDGLYASVSRKDKTGKPEPGWYPKQKMTAEEALRGFTTGAAFASFREDEAGVIRKGAVADLTVLDVDPVTANEKHILNARVDLTIIDGEIVWARE